MDLETIDTVSIADILGQDWFDGSVFPALDGVCSSTSSPRLSSANHSLQASSRLPRDGEFDSRPRPSCNQLPQYSHVTQNAFHGLSTNKASAEDRTKRKGGVLTNLSGNSYRKRCSAFGEWKSNAGVQALRGQRNGQHLLKRCMHMMKDLYNHRRSSFIMTGCAGDHRDDEQFAGGHRTFNGYDKLAIHHVIAERKRREKLNESFSAIHALLPDHIKTLKKDRASILLHTKEYVIHLKARLRELEQRNSILEALFSNNTAGSPSAALNQGGCSSSMTDSAGAGYTSHWPSSDEVTVEAYKLSNIEPFGAELRVCVRNPSNRENIVMSLLQCVKAMNFEALSIHCEAEPDSEFRVAVQMKGKADFWNELRVRLRAEPPLI